jgi:hypothetical protein
MAQVVEFLPSKCEAPSSILSTMKEKFLKVPRLMLHLFLSLGHD